MEPATLKELKAKFPKADAAWLLSQVEAEATLVDAAASYGDYCQAKADAAIKAAEETAKTNADKALAAAKKESDDAIAAAKAEAASKSGALGAKPFTLADGGDEHQETGNAIEDFEGAVANHMLRYKSSREDALNAVRRNNRGLLQAYLLATNPGKHSTRVLEERFDAIDRAEKRVVA